MIENSKNMKKTEFKILIGIKIVISLRNHCSLKHFKFIWNKLKLTYVPHTHSKILIKNLSSSHFDRIINYWVDGLQILFIHHL